MTDFLVSLLSSDSEPLQSFAALQIGSHKIAVLRADVEQLLQASSQSQVQFHCLAGLGRLGSAESLDVVLRYLNSPDPGLRKAAIHAAGFIGGSEIVTPLVERYGIEDQKWHRLAIIEAIERVPDVERTKEALTAFKTGEDDPLLTSMISRRLTRLQQ